MIELLAVTLGSASLLGFYGLLTWWLANERPETHGNDENRSAT